MKKAHIRGALVATIGLFGLAAAGAAPAPADPAPAAAAAPAPKPEKPRMVCQDIQQMGSHFKRRVCATPEDWETRRRRDQEEMQRMGDHASGCGGGANPC